MGWRGTVSCPVKYDDDLRRPGSSGGGAVDPEASASRRQRRAGWKPAAPGTTTAAGADAVGPVARPGPRGETSAVLSTHNESRAGPLVSLRGWGFVGCGACLVAGVLDQGHLTGALDCKSDLALVLAAIAGLACLADPTAIVDELTKQVEILVVNGAACPGISAMDALLLPPSRSALAPPSCGSTFVCHLPRASLSTIACLSMRV